MYALRLPKLNFVFYIQACHPLADQLTLFQPGGTDHAHLITTGTPGFSDLPTALGDKVHYPGVHYHKVQPKFENYYFRRCTGNSF